MNYDKLKIKSKIIKGRQPLYLKRYIKSARNLTSAVHHVLGNHGLKTFVNPHLKIQPKLSFSQPNDRFEQEADRVSEQVMRIPEGYSQAVPVAFKVSKIVQSQTLEKEKDDEEKVVQTKASEVSAIQRQEEKEDQEQALVQSKTGSSAQGKAEANLQSTLQSRKGFGQPLPASERRFFEPRFGVDLSSVRIHTDSTASALAKQLNAEAFTYGRDIFFNSGRYNPSTSSGKKLLAHELTHVLQQNSAMKRLQMKKTEKQTSQVDPTKFPESIGRFEPESERIVFDKVTIAGFKLKAHRGALYNDHLPLIYHKNFNRGSTNQRQIWETGIETSAIQRKIKEILKNSFKEDSIDEGKTYVVKVNLKDRNVPLYYFGTVKDISRKLVIPQWGGTSKRPPSRFFHVDHIVELQLADWGGKGSGWANTLTNMELLEGKLNQTSGRYIKGQINKKVKGFINKTKTPDGKSPFGTSPGDVKKNYHLVFKRAVAGKYDKISSLDFWTKEDIKQGKHLAPVRAALLSEIGGQGYVRVFPTEAGGLGKSFKWPGKLDKTEAEWFGAPFIITRKDFNVRDNKDNKKGKTFGYFYVNIDPENKIFYPFEKGDHVVEISRIADADFAGYINKSSIRKMLHRLKIKKASPVQIDTFDLMPDGGIFCSGRVLTDIPLFNKADIQFQMEKDRFSLFKTFTVEDIEVPEPFSITSSTLTLFGDTKRGVGLEGKIDFGIKELGEGYIKASVSTGESLALEGMFSFEHNIFDPASVKVSYKDRMFSVEGNIGIPSGKVKGIKNAVIKVQYSEKDGRVSADGNAELDIPGLKSASVQVNYSKDEFSISGSAELGSDIPGIKSGNISVSISRKGPEKQYSLKAKGEAVPDIPGVNTNLQVTYDDGLLLITGKAQYSKGMLSGEVEINVSNRQIDKDGRPTEGLSDRLNIYGGGELTITFTPWLKGTAGVRFLPDGQLQVSGTIGLPSSVDVFKRKSIPEKSLFSLNFDIPIFAIPVGPKSIGLVATIRGSLKAYAGIGPGRLEALELSVVYNPAREEDTVVTGKGKFVVPADAGLRLAVSASIGLSAVVGGVEGGLEVAGGVGLSARAEAGVGVQWSPRTGIVLQALLAATIEPKFRFDIEGFIRAWFAFYEKRWAWNLAHYEYGPNFKFGMYLPITYKEGEPFDISFRDIKFVTPEINKDFLRGLINDIRNRRN